MKHLIITFLLASAMSMGAAVALSDTNSTRVELCNGDFYTAPTLGLDGSVHYLLTNCDFNSSAPLSVSGSDLVLEIAGGNANAIVATGAPFWSFTNDAALQINFAHNGISTVSVVGVTLNNGGLVFSGVAEPGSSIVIASCILTSRYIRTAAFDFASALLNSTTVTITDNKIDLKYSRSQFAIDFPNGEYFEGTAANAIDYAYVATAVAVNATVTGNRIVIEGRASDEEDPENYAMQAGALRAMTSSDAHGTAGILHFENNHAQFVGSFSGSTSGIIADLYGSPSGLEIYCNNNTFLGASQPLRAALTMTSKLTFTNNYALNQQRSLQVYVHPTPSKGAAVAVNISNNALSSYGSYASVKTFMESPMATGSSFIVDSNTIITTSLAESPFAITMPRQLYTVGSTVSYSYNTVAHSSGEVRESFESWEKLFSFDLEPVGPLRSSAFSSMSSSTDAVKKAFGPLNTNSDATSNATILFIWNTLFGNSVATEEEIRRLSAQFPADAILPFTFVAPEATTTTTLATTTTTTLEETTTNTEEATTTTTTATVPPVGFISAASSSGASSAFAAIVAVLVCAVLQPIS